MYGQLIRDSVAPLLVCKHIERKCDANQMTSVVKTQARTKSPVTRTLQLSVPAASAAGAMPTQ